MRTLVICVCLGLSRLVAQVGDASLTVEVRDRTGARIPGARAELQSESSRRVYGIAPDDSRAYRFAGLPAGDYTLKLFKPGFKSLTVKSIHLSGGEQRLMPPLELEIDLGCHGDPGFDYLRFLPSGSRVGNLGGSVRLDQGPMAGKGPPVAGADVSLVCSGGLVCYVTSTDSLGGFMFRNLPAGRFSVRVNHAGFYQWEEAGYRVKEGLELIYDSIAIERCPEGNCDPWLRPKKPIVTCE